MRINQLIQSQFKLIKFLNKEQNYFETKKKIIFNPNINFQTIMKHILRELESYKTDLVCD